MPAGQLRHFAFERAGGLKVDCSCWMMVPVTVGAGLGVVRLVQHDQQEV
jgi:hypothetical protein